MEKDGLRTKSFRYEDYNTRRVFLRSYPLNFGDESEAEESKADLPQKSKGAAGKHNNKHESAAYVVKGTPAGKKPMKKIILAFVQWGEERVVVLRRFKHKITIYVVSCVPMTLKAPTGLISIK